MRIDCERAASAPLHRVLTACADGHKRPLAHQDYGHTIFRFRRLRGEVSERIPAALSSQVLPPWR